MPKKILIVIDMQNDFVCGTLGSPSAQAIINVVIEKINRQKNADGDVIFTLDTHGQDYLSTEEGKHLPVKHCIKGTSGHELFSSIKCPNAAIIEKNTFGHLNWQGINDGDELELCGLCTDICVVSNALILKAKFPNSKITVDSAACAGTSIAAHEAAILVMRSCQIEII